MTTAWVDGSSDPAGRGPAGWGVVMRTPCGRTFSLSGALAPGTGATGAEVEAVLRALANAPPRGALRIFTDCRGVADAAAGRTDGVDVPRWPDLVEAAAAFPVPLEIVRRRRCADDGMAAAHHLAAAARAVARLGGM